MRKPVKARAMVERARAFARNSFHDLSTLLFKHEKRDYEFGATPEGAIPRAVTAERRHIYRLLSGNFSQKVAVGCESGSENFTL